MSLDGSAHIRHPSTVAPSRALQLDLDHVIMSGHPSTHMLALRHRAEASFRKTGQCY
jgi:hypothetical protein